MTEFLSHVIRISSWMQNSHYLLKAVCFIIIDSSFNCPELYLCVPYLGLQDRLPLRQENPLPLESRHPAWTPLPSIMGMSVPLGFLLHLPLRLLLHTSGPLSFSIGLLSCSDSVLCPFQASSPVSTPLAWSVLLFDPSLLPFQPTSCDTVPPAFLPYPFSVSPSSLHFPLYPAQNSLPCRSPQPPRSFPSIGLAGQASPSPYFVPASEPLTSSGRLLQPGHFLYSPSCSPHVSPSSPERRHPFLTTNSVPPNGPPATGQVLCRTWL